MNIDYKGIYLKPEDLDGLKHKKIIIFGAGTYASFLYTYLCIKKMENQVFCFAVSEKRNNEDILFGKPVTAFDQLSGEASGAVILAAVSRKYAGDVLAKIRQGGMNEYRLFSQESAEWAAWEIFKACQRFPMKENKLFFYCYEGMGYRCNCKYIAESLLDRQCPVELVWAVSSEEHGAEIPGGIRTVLTGTEEYYRELYTSAVVIENDGKDPFAYKRPGQYCINTWHGYGPFKKVGGALPGSSREKMREYYSYYDLFLTASRFYSKVYRDSFCFEGEILERGAPRNDLFFQENHAGEKVRALYHIPPDKGIVLLAPTYRNDKPRAFDQYDMDLGKVLDCIGKKFQKKYVMMYRFHHQLYKEAKGAGYYAEGIDATLYPDIQELLAAADMVITDYSSLMWDFSLQRRPVFLYQKDLEEYADRRGFYAPVSQWPYPRAHTEKELLEVIQNFDPETYEAKLDRFLELYGSCDDGHGAEAVVERIMNRVKEQRNG